MRLSFLMLLALLLATSSWAQGPPLQYVDNSPAASNLGDNLYSAFGTLNGDILTSIKVPIRDRSLVDDRAVTVKYDHVRPRGLDAAAAVTSPKGGLYLRDDGSQSRTLYVNELGTTSSWSPAITRFYH